MNENDFSAAFDAEDAFASRMDYMRRKRRRRRRRREVEKEEEEKVRRQRASEPRRICFVLDGTQKITRNSRSHLGQGLVKYCSRFETFARSANASLEKSHGSPQRGRVANRGAREYREWDGLGFLESEILRDFFSRGMKSYRRAASGRTVARLGNANASLEKIPANPQTRKAGRVANREAKRVRGNGMG